MRLAKLIQKRDGQELRVALAKIFFESMDDGPIHKPALRNAGVRFVGRRRNRRQDRQGPYAEAGDVVGVDWSLELMRAADRRETSPKDRHRGPPEPLSWLPFRFTMSAVGSPVSTAEGRPC